jgi:hypothetical protein
MRLRLLWPLHLLDINLTYSLDEKVGKNPLGLDSLRKRHLHLSREVRLETHSR